MRKLLLLLFVVAFCAAVCAVAYTAVADVKPAWQAVTAFITAISFTGMTVMIEKFKWERGY